MLFAFNLHPLLQTHIKEASADPLLYFCDLSAGDAV